MSSLPFTTAQFLDVFRRYNESVWPGQWLLNLLAIVAVGAALAGGRSASKIATGIVAALWIWMGAVYHLTFFRAINPAALAFGSLFIIEGLLIAWFGVVRSSVRFDQRPNSATPVGLALIAYALVVYPLVGYALGHRYPSSPTFGVPCPTTIFTLGVLLLAPPPRLRVLIVIPVLWGVVGFTAAVKLGMWEDYGLLIAAVLATAVVFGQRSGPHEIATDQRAVAAAAG
jgi:hypothetical protein